MTQSDLIRVNNTMVDPDKVSSVAIKNYSVLRILMYSFVGLLGILLLGSDAEARFSMAFETEQYSNLAWNDWLGFAMIFAFLPAAGHLFGLLTGDKNYEVWRVVVSLDNGKTVKSASLKRPDAQDLLDRFSSPR